MTDDIIVVSRVMAKLARVARLAILELAVNYYSNAYSPAYVHKNHVFQASATAFYKLGISHASCIVLYADW